MSTKITINDDQTLTVTWEGKKGRGSLYHTMALGNAEAVNKLDLEELLTVGICAKNIPFPLGQGEKVYADILKEVREGKFPQQVETLKKYGLGIYRQILVEQSGDSCNGPWDSYMNIAVKLKETSNGHRQ